MNLAVDAFIERLLKHVPMPGQPMVRYSGLYSVAGRKKLNLTRAAMGQQAVSERQNLRWQENTWRPGELCHLWITLDYKETS